MICEHCGGPVIWCGPLSALTHTECQNCGGINCQIPEVGWVTDEVLGEDLHNIEETK